MHLKTNKGKLFDVDWVGVSSFDGALRFSVKSANVNDLFFVFTDSGETVKLVSEVDGIEVEYEGYTKFCSIGVEMSGSTVVALMKE